MISRKYRNADKLAAFIALQLEVEKARLLMRVPNTDCLVTNSYDLTRYKATPEDVRDSLRYLGVRNEGDLPVKTFVNRTLDELAVIVLRVNPSLSLYDRKRMARYVCGFKRYDQLKKGAMVKCRKLPRYG